MRVLTPEKLKPFVDDASALGAEAFVVASYGKIVPQALLDAGPIAFNVHPSLLPLYRGATPLQSAIRDGRTETGVTIIAMDAGMDTGDVLLQERTPIGATETYGELHDRLANRGAELVLDTLHQYSNGTLKRTAQATVARQLGIGDDEVERTRTHPLRKDDLAIDWRSAPGDVVRLVRSLVPAPLARTAYAGEAVKIMAAHALSLEELQAQLGGHKPWVAVGLSVSGLRGRELLYAVHPDGAVVVDRLIAPNRGPLSGPAYVRGVLAIARARLDEATR